MIVATQKWTTGLAQPGYGAAGHLEPCGVQEAAWGLK